MKRKAMSQSVVRGCVLSTLGRGTCLRVRRMARSLAVALGLALLLGCYDRTQHQYENDLHREIEAFEFHRPIAEVWRELIAVLSEDGFTFNEPLPVEGRTVETALRAASFPHSGYRVLVRVVRLGKDRYKLSLLRQYQSDNGDAGVSRSIEDWNVSGKPGDRLAWTLIERTEPQRAAAIVQQLRKSNSRSFWN